MTARPALIEVTLGREDLLFRYKDAKGDEQSAMKISEIPAESLERVQVIDLSRSPSERSARGYVQLFNLKSANVDGTYPGRVVSRVTLEEALATAQALPEQAPIIMYSTEWCGVCKKARAFMKSEGIAFVEKDIERDKAAAKELQDKLRRSGTPSNGVPVIDINGQLMRGFDPSRLLTLARSPAQR